MLQRIDPRILTIVGGLGIVALSFWVTVKVLTHLDYSPGHRTAGENPPAQSTAGRPATPPGSRQRVNLVVQSENFAAPNWGNFIGVTAAANATAAPSRQNSASKLAETAGPASVHHLERSIPLPSPGNYVFSLFVKSAERNGLAVEMLDRNGKGELARAVYEISSGGVVTKAGAATAGGVEDVGQDWHRIWLAMPLASNTAAVGLTLLNKGAAEYPGQAGAGLYIWGAQLEPGEKVSDYVPTNDGLVKP